MPLYIEFWGDEEIVSTNFLTVFAQTMDLDDEQVCSLSTLSKVDSEFFEITTYELTERTFVISLRFKSRKTEKGTEAAVTTLNTLLDETKTDIEFYFVDELMCSRKNGGVNLFFAPNILPRRQFWKSHLLKRIAVPYTRVNKRGKNGMGVK